MRWFFFWTFLILLLYTAFSFWFYPWYTSLGSPSVSANTSGTSSQLKLLDEVEPEAVKPSSTTSQISRCYELGDFATDFEAEAVRALLMESGGTVLLNARSTGAHDVFVLAVPSSLSPAEQEMVSGVLVNQGLRRFDAEDPVLDGYSAYGPFASSAIVEAYLLEVQSFAPQVEMLKVSVAEQIFSLQVLGLEIGDVQAVASQLGLSQQKITLVSCN